MATKEFWDEKHEKKDIFWLTNSRPTNVLCIHKLAIPLSAIVLDIGVGLGGFARWCHSRGNKVVSCDISEAALAKVNGVADAVLISDLATVGPVDIAVCHLVFQHCYDEQILHILQNVKLTPGGVFSFQYASKVRTMSDYLEKAEQDGLLYFRDPNVMDSLIVKAPNLKVAWRSGTFFPAPTEKAISWEVIHLVAADSTIVPDDPSIEAIYDHIYRKKPKYGDLNHSQTVASKLMSLSFDTVLDIGCGGGHFLAHMASKGKSVSGIDISGEAVKIASSRCADGDIRQGAIEGIPIGHVFDLVTAFDVLEHVPEDNVSSAISELARVAKNDVVVSIAFNADVVLGHALHLTVENQAWWIAKLQQKFKVVDVIDTVPNKAYFHLRKTEI